MNQALKKAKVGEPANCEIREVPKEARHVLGFDAITLDTKEKLFETINNIPEESVVAFDTETTGLDTRNDRMVGFSFSYEDTKAYYVPLAHSYLGVGEQIEDVITSYSIHYTKLYECQ